MTLLIAWLVFPIVLGLLSLGCGLLLETAAGTPLPGPLLLPAGFVVVSLTTQFAHLSDATAELGTPAVVVLAVVGLGLSLPERQRRIDGWVVGAAAAVYAVFAAPVVLTGRATFLGYIKLDDTANYLAMLDRAMHHGYNTAGLGPPPTRRSSARAYVAGYPLGSLAAARHRRRPCRTGRDLAVAALPGLPGRPDRPRALSAGLGAGRMPRPLRALVAFGGAQAALIYGYAMWGGIKELATAAAAVLLVALVPPTVANRARARSILPLSAAAAGILGLLTVQGAVWLVVPLAGTALLVWRAGGLQATARTAGAFLAGVAVLGIPAFAAAGPWLAQAGVYRTEAEYANLVQRLSWLQVFGVWPHGDFRTPPNSLDVTYVLVAVVGVAAARWPSRSHGAGRVWELPLAAGTAAFACAVYLVEGSPLDRRQGPRVGRPRSSLTLALAGAAVAFERGRRVEGGIVAGVVLAGVLWSNALQYHDVWVAPTARLSELQKIGHRFAGQGPTLMTEFEAYGARHFLRNMDAEAASELRAARDPPADREGGRHRCLAGHRRDPSSRRCFFPTRRSSCVAPGSPAVRRRPTRWSRTDATTRSGSVPARRARSSSTSPSAAACSPRPSRRAARFSGSAGSRPRTAASSRPSSARRRS